VIDPITVAKLWLLVKPWKRLKERRAKRKGKGMAIDIGTRTSTNAAVGGGTLGLVYVNLVEMLPYPHLVAALTTPSSLGSARRKPNQAFCKQRTARGVEAPRTALDSSHTV
jgi:hypothetical protein